MSLVDDDKNSTSNMLQANCIYILLDMLSMPFKNTEDMEYGVNNKRIALNMAASNRLKILKYFNIHNERMKTPLKMNDWVNIDNEKI